MNAKIISELMILQFAVVLCFISCSVKEDRSACPCMLVLDLSEVDVIEKDSENINIVGSGGFIYEEKVHASLSAKEYIVAVPRTGVFLNVSHGSNNSFTPDKGFVVSSGHNFPPLYLYSSYVDTDCETTTAKVVMHKEHCNINIVLKAILDSSQFSISVKGDICGVGLDSTPLPGSFRFAPKLESDGSYCVRVPRQTSSSLILEILDKKGVLRSFSIGEYIIESGYDWTTENLEDVDVVIDYAEMEVVLVVNGWEETIHFDVEM